MKTATKWLFEWMENKQYFIGNDLLDAFNQAKEMEKQQIIDAHTLGYIIGGGNGDLYNPKEYYNETFNKGQK